MSRTILAICIVIFGVFTTHFSGQTSPVVLDDVVALSGPHHDNNCSVVRENFPLQAGDLRVFNADNGIFFTAGMTIDADGAPNAYAPQNRGLDYTANARGGDGWVALVTGHNGLPVIQKTGRYRGYYISTTSLQQAGIDDVRDPKKYIDATKIPYIALPSDFARAFSIHLGDLAVVINRANGTQAYAIFADVGPEGRIGEGSIALAKRLGIPSNPRRDSVDDGVTYLIFPGSGPLAGGRVTEHKVRNSAARLYHRWGGLQRLRACELASSVISAVPATK